MRLKVIKFVLGELEDWPSVREKYICDGSWSAEFHLVITNKGVLELRPCSDEIGPMGLMPDSA